MPSRNTPISNIVKISPPSLVTPGGSLRNISFPSLPDIGTALIIANHPFEVVGGDTIEYSDGTVHPAIVWKSRCYICAKEYKVKGGLNGTPSAYCEEHRKNGEDPKGTKTRIEIAKDKILDTIKQNGRAEYARMVTHELSETVLNKAFNELEINGIIIRKRSRKRIYIMAK